MIVPKYSREIPQRFRLEAEKCTNCGYIAFPPRQICPDCKNKSFQMVSLKPEGTILTYTIIHVASEAVSTQTPFAVAIIETTEGARLTSQVVDCSPEEVATGKKVKLVLRCIQKEGKAGILQYGYKAVLIR
jgi:uncharacterized OB-fold protein